MSNSASVKGGATLFFTIFHTGAVSGDDAIGLLDRADAADIHADAGVKLQGFSAGRGLGIAEHDADLLADLVGENAAGARLRDEGGQFAQRGAHQAGLRAHGGVADFPFQLLFRHERRDGIEHDHIKRVGADQRLDNAERFLARAGLRNEQVIHIHAQTAGILRIERVLDVDERSEAAALLRLGDNRERERGLSRGFRTENFNHSAARKAADTQGPDRSKCCPWG